jgi:hypothetical protein
LCQLPRHLPIIQADFLQYFSFASQQIGLPRPLRRAAFPGGSEICAPAFLAVVKNWRKY